MLDRLRFPAIVAAWMTAPAAGLACSAPPPAPKTAPVTPTVSVPGSTATVPPRPEPPTASELRCKLSTTQWQRDQVSVDLQLGGGGPVFARVHGGAATIEVGQSPHAGLQISSSGVTLVGAVDTEAVRWFPARAIVFAGFAIPRPSSPLVLGGMDQTIHAAHLLGPEVRTPSRASAKLGCEDVALDVANFDAVAAVDRDEANPGKLMMLTGSNAIELRGKPTGAVVAKLAPELLVTTIGEAGAMSRIVAELEREVVFGWVRSERLEEVSSPTAQAIDDPFNIGRLGLSGIGGATAVSCPNTLGLLVRIAGRRGPIGTVAPGTTLWLSHREPPLTSVTVRGDFEIASNADLFVHTSELADCKP